MAINKHEQFLADQKQHVAAIAVLFGNDIRGVEKNNADFEVEKTR